MAPPLPATAADKGDAVAVASFAHLVGSLPGDTPEEAMRLALERLGPHLRWLPDGETGERRDWIVHIIESLRSHPDLELRREGAWNDYDDVPRFAVRDGHTLTGESLDFGHVAAFEHSYPLFTKLRAEHGRDDLAFQVGLPGDLDMALFTLGPTGPLRHRAAFTEAILRQIRAIHQRAGDDVVFQIEVPAELVFVARTPGPAQPAVAGYLAGGLADLAAAAPIGTRFGIHLCLGDMNHRALGRLRDVRPVVALANALQARWPPRARLEFVHVPLAAAEEPPPNRRGFYRPLQGLALEPDVAVIAGFVHERLSPGAHRALLDHLTELAGRPVAVATSCGLGRRERESASATLDRAAHLCR